MKKRHYFTTDFKVNVVRMIQYEGKTQAKVAEELGIHPNTINNWLKQHIKTASTPKSE